MSTCGHRASVPIHVKEDPVSLLLASFTSHKTTRSTWAIWYQTTTQSLTITMKGCGPHLSASLTFNKTKRRLGNLISNDWPGIMNYTNCKTKVQMISNTTSTISVNKRIIDDGRTEECKEDHTMVVCETACCKLWVWRIKKWEGNNGMMDRPFCVGLCRKPTRKLRRKQPVPVLWILKPWGKSC